MNLGLYLRIKTSQNCLGIYEKSKIIHEKNYFETVDSYFFLNKKNIILKSNNQFDEDENGEILLFHIRKQNNYFQIENNPGKNMPLTEKNINILNYKLWYVIDNNNIINDVYYLTQNDIIRFGNFKFILKKIQINKKDIKNKIIKKLRYDINEINLSKKDISPNFEPILDFFKIAQDNNDEADKKCHFCDKENCSEENPLVKLCACDKYKHFKCIKEDLRKKVVIIKNKKETSINYYIKFHCHKCKEQLPLKFKLEENGKTYELLDIEIPYDKEYLLFQSLDYLNRTNEYQQSIHLVKLIGDKNIIQITIGRDGHDRDNDIKIVDESVSRKQAIIEYDKECGSFILKNISQKSDSLILIKNILIINKYKIHFQIGKIFVEAFLENENEVDKNKITKIQDKKKYKEDLEAHIKNQVSSNISLNDSIKTEIYFEDYFRK